MVVDACGLLVGCPLEGGSRCKISFPLLRAKPGRERKTLDPLFVCLRSRACVFFDFIALQLKTIKKKSTLSSFITAYHAYYFPFFLLFCLWSYVI